MVKILLPFLILISTISHAVTVSSKGKLLDLDFKNIKIDESINDRLGVPFKRQHTQVWCWAAVSAMIIQYYRGVYVEDCTLLSEYFGTNCCGYPEQCTRPGLNEEMIYIMKRYNVWYRQERVLKFNEVVNDINDEWPIVVGLMSKNPNERIGHVVVIAGYDYPDFVYVHDPMNSSGFYRMRYNDLFYYGNMQWSFSLTMD
jgi:hypothetical protein